MITSAAGECLIIGYYHNYAMLLTFFFYRDILKMKWHSKTWTYFIHDSC